MHLIVKWIFLSALISAYEIGCLVTLKTQFFMLDISDMIQFLSFLGKQNSTNPSVIGWFSWGLDSHF